MAFKAKSISWPSDHHGQILAWSRRWSWYKDQLKLAPYWEVSDQRDVMFKYEELRKLWSILNFYNNNGNNNNLTLALDLALLFFLWKIKDKQNRSI